MCLCFCFGIFSSNIFNNFHITLYTNHIFTHFMARFERSKGGRSKRDSRGSSSRRDSRNSGTFEDHFKGRGRRDSGRRSKSYGRDRRDSRGRRDLEMTKVICSSCGKECEVPFKPTSSKPVYCDDCFAKKGKGGSAPDYNKDFEIINAKLDKIMKALKNK